MRFVYLKYTYAWAFNYESFVLYAKSLIGVVDNVY